MKNTKKPLYKHTINDGGASGAIIGRNIFQRKREEALAILEKVTNIFNQQS